MKTFPVKINYQIHFESLLPNLTDFGDVVRTWHELIDLVEEVEFNSEEGPIKVTVDWGNARQFISELDKRAIRVRDIKSKEDFDKAIQNLDEYVEGVRNGIIQRYLIVNCVVEGQHKKNCVGYLTNLLYQIFLTQNIASPGSCDFYSVQIVPLDLDQDLEKTAIRLSTGVMEGGILLRDELNWPKLETIPVELVWKWIQTLGLGSTQLAQTNIERATFAFLHMCHNDWPSPTDLLWLAHALEALYDTPELGISKALRDRIFLVLGKPDQGFKAIRQAINKFYSLRSQFVHGDLAIINPMVDMTLNTKFDDHAEQILNSLNFATIIIIATLQKLVLNNWSSLRFSEEFSGTPTSFG